MKIFGLTILTRRGLVKLRDHHEGEATRIMEKSEQNLAKTEANIQKIDILQNRVEKLIRKAERERKECPKRERPRRIFPKITI